MPAEATCRIRAAFNSSRTHFDLTAAGESTIRKYFASEIPLLIFPGMLSPSRTSSLSYQTEDAARGQVGDELIHEIFVLARVRNENLAHVSFDCEISQKRGVREALQSKDT